MDLADIKSSLMAIDNSSKSIDYEEIKNVLKRLKEVSLSNHNQDEAKRIWCFETIADIRYQYNQAFRLLKEEKFYKAWCALERVEILIGHLMPHFVSVGEDKYKVGFIASQIVKFQSLFPYKIFLSPEFVNIEKFCSVCNQRIALRKHCGHRVGEIYNGEMCYRIIRNVEIAGTALTENPSQKYSVPFLIDSKTNKSVDHYNYQAIQFLSKRLLSGYSEWTYTKYTFLGELDPKFKFAKRNEPCPCGSDKKYKRCHIDKSRKEKEHIRFHVNDVIDMTLPTLELPEDVQPFF